MEPEKLTGTQRTVLQDSLFHSAGHLWQHKMLLPSLPFPSKEFILKQKPVQLSGMLQGIKPINPLFTQFKMGMTPQTQVRASSTLLRVV